MMIKNYITVSIRKFARQKFYSLVNLFGLMIGLTSVILIMLFVVDEFSYDRFHTNADRIYRVVENQYYAGQPVFPVAVTPVPLGPSLAQEYAGVEKATRFWFINLVLKNEEQQFRERGAFVDSSFFDIFSFQVLSGNPNEALAQIDGLVLTQKLAQKYFGTENPIGKMINVNGEREARVGAVIKNPPGNSHLQFDFLVPFHGLTSTRPELATQWQSNTLYTYVLVRAGASVAHLNEQIIDHIRKNRDGSVTDIYLQPLTDIHLGKVHFTADVGGKGNSQYVSIFLVVAICILLIACINFMNLATARSAKRAKEVGLRKTIGATRTQLVFQFLSESILTTIIAMMLSILLVDLLLPQFNLLSGKDLSFSFWSNIDLWSYLIGFALLTGLLAGSYPAVFLSAFQPASVLKSSNIKVGSGAFFRKLLVVVQFCVSITMIVGTIIVYSQIEFIREKNLGYVKENVVKIPRVSQSYESFKDELLSNSEIVNVAASDQHPLYVENSTSGLDWQGKNDDDIILIHYQQVDYDYVETMGMKMLSGRSFSREYGSDSLSIIINTEAQRIMGFDNPIGQSVQAGPGAPSTIIGVVEDFHFKSIHQKIEPLVMFIGSDSDNLSYTMVRLQEGDPKEKLATLEQIWKKFNPEREFVYTFLDADFNDLYRAEEQTGILFKYFSGLAIFISCLGLFGLASFSLEQRTKEFGIRKIFGASVIQLFSSASIGFIALVLIAFTIAVPISWYLVNQWLSGFAYHVEFGYRVFLWSGIMAVGIAFVTVSYQSIKSAIMNPANSLRHE